MKRISGIIQQAAVLAAIAVGLASVPASAQSSGGAGSTAIPQFQDARRLPGAAAAPAVGATASPSEDDSRRALEARQQAADADAKRAAADASKRLEAEAEALRKRLEAEASEHRKRIEKEAADLARQLREESEARRKAEAAAAEAARLAEQEAARKAVAVESDRKVASEARVCVTGAADDCARARCLGAASERAFADATIKGELVAERQGWQQRCSVETARQAAERAAEQRFAADARACVSSTADSCAKTACLEGIGDRRFIDVALKDELSGEAGRWRRQCTAATAEASAPKAVAPAASAPAPALLAPAAATPTAPATIIDGIYSTHVRPGCGQAFQSVQLRIEAGAIAFEHLFQGVPYGWTGTIDGNGAIKASVGGGAAFQASGMFADQRVELRYPQCGTPIVMQIRWRTQ